MKYLFFVFLFCFQNIALKAQKNDFQFPDSVYATPQNVAVKMLECISSDSLKAANFKGMRALFEPAGMIHAVIENKEGVSQTISYNFDVFEMSTHKFYKKSDFKEWPVSHSVVLYKDIASVYQYFKTSLAAESYSEGYNFYQMMKVEGKWKIVSLVFQAK